MWIVLLIGYAGAISYMSHQPLTVGEAPFPHVDKLAHLIEFGLFMALAWQATGRRRVLAWIVTLAFASLDECHQAFVPARDASLLDLAADMAGATLVIGLIHPAKRLWRFLRVRILSR